MANRGLNDEPMTAYDPNGELVDLQTDEIKRLLVSTTPRPPSTATLKSISALGNIGAAPGITAYTITNGKTLCIQVLKGGAAGGASGSKVSIYEDPNGDLAVLNLIEVVYCDTSSQAVTLNEKYVGNGTRRIILERFSFSASAREIYGKWEGYEL